jgi:formate dehydrogenase major subunit
VVQDIFLTETAGFADVVLPAAAWPEKVGTVTNTNRQVQMGRQAIAPPGEARPDWWITQELARRIGLDWRYAHPRDTFAEMAAQMPSLANISWDRVAREESVTYPCDGPDQPGHDVVFGKGFPRAGGTARLVAAKLTPPDEAPDESYPLILTTGRQLEHWHTGAMSRRAAVLDSLEPGPVACLAAEEIARLGIAPGDRVRVTTRRGSVVLAARADEAVPAGVVFIPFAYVEAAANLLTNPALDPFGKIPEFKYCAARVEKADAREEAARADH